MTVRVSSHWFVQAALGVVFVALLTLGLSARHTPALAPQAQAANGECAPGYYPDASGQCQDFDECRYNNGECDATVTCTNSPGGRTCGACTNDWVGDGYYGCKDPNECASGGCSPVDNKPPAIRTSGSQNVTATGADGAPAKFWAVAYDNVDGALPVTCAPKSGSTFPMGPTTVTCSAEDKKGNKKSVTLTVNVK